VGKVGGPIEEAGFAVSHWGDTEFPSRGGGGSFKYGKYLKVDIADPFALQAFPDYYLTDLPDNLASYARG